MNNRADKKASGKHGGAQAAAPVLRLRELAVGVAIIALLIAWPLLMVSRQIFITNLSVRESALADSLADVGRQCAAQRLYNEKLSSTARIESIMREHRGSRVSVGRPDHRAARAERERSRRAGDTGFYRDYQETFCPGEGVDAMFRARAYFVACLLAALGLGIVARLFYIQIVHGSEYAQESRRQAQQRVLLYAKRGDLLDRKGRVLATSTGSQLTLDATLLAAQNGPEQPDSAEGRVLLRRVYPYGDAAGAVLGYVGKDGYGLGGAEFVFDKYLRGESGWAIVMRDGRNRRYPTLDLPRKQPETGGDVYLTIDINVQKIAENVIRQTVSSLNAKGAMCIVMEPATGRILAMVNEPEFNPNMPARYSLDARINKCIGYTYEPGSTFKAVTAACALQEGVKKETDIIDGNHGVFEVYDEKIRDEKPYGKLTFSEALSYSSNVCFAKVANDIGNERLYKYARDFGFGDRVRHHASPARKAAWCIPSRNGRAARA